MSTLLRTVLRQNRATLPWHTSLAFVAKLAVSAITPIHFGGAGGSVAAMFGSDRPEFRRQQRQLVLHVFEARRNAEIFGRRFTAMHATKMDALRKQLDKVRQRAAEGYRLALLIFNDLQAVFERTSDQTSCRFGFRL